MTTIEAWIFDASVAAKWYLRDEQLLDQADKVLDRFGEGTIGLAAPEYLQVAIELNLPLLTADRPFFERIFTSFPTTTYLGHL